MKPPPTALVTGGTSGIGLAICQVLAPDHHVFVGGRELARCQAVANSLPHATPFVAELMDESATARAASALPPLDVLVHSAGIAGSSPVSRTNREEWRRIFELNVFAVVDLTRLLLPGLRATHGMVITINSGAGFHAGPESATYAGSKFALRAFTDALREEERGTVRVTSIHPGRVDTPMQVQIMAAAGKPYQPNNYLPPADVAQSVRLAVEADPRSCVEELVIRPALS